MNAMSKVQLIFVAVAGALVLGIILVFTGVLPGLQPKQVKATIKVWEVGPYSAESATKLLKDAYPRVTFEYKSFDSVSTYEDALLEAFATGQPPDIFMVSSESFPRFANKIAAFPETSISLAQLRSLFPQVVEQAFVKQGKVFALPLSIDTLALIYNRDLLGSAGITTPPSTWEELQADVPALIKKDAAGNIAVAATTLGASSKSMRNVHDLLSAMMMQRGVPMVTDTGSSATFATQQATDALTYYTQFADASSTLYTWSDAMPPALDTFSQEKVAMTFGYLEDVKEIKKRSQYLNFDVAPLPQPRALLDAGKSMSYPRMFGYAVSRQSPNYATAWNIVLALTTNEATDQAYIDGSNTSPALLTLINKTLSNATLHVFAKQALVAKLWQKPNNTLAETTFSTMVENTTSKKLRAQDALYAAQSEINRSFIPQ